MVLLVMLVAFLADFGPINRQRELRLALAGSSQQPKSWDYWLAMAKELSYESRAKMMWGTSHPGWPQKMANRKFLF